MDDILRVILMKAFWLGEFSVCDHMGGGDGNCIASDNALMSNRRQTVMLSEHVMT